MNIIITKSLCSLLLFAIAIGTSLAATLITKSEPSLPILNDRPIIGILSQEISYHLDSKWPGEFKSFIAASYVKFLEGGGARVVPIW